MKLTPSSLAKVLPAFKSRLPRASLDALWNEAQPSNYRYSLRMSLLPTILLCAFLRRATSTEQILKLWGKELATKTKSSLSYALRRPALGRFLALILQSLAHSFMPRPGDLVVLDSMAMTVSSRRRSDARKFNDKTVGGGLLWAFWLDAPGGANPVRLLKMVRGAWNDSKLLRSCEPLLKGPIYLMDRGFFCFELLKEWLGGGIHFIVRAKKRNVSCQEVVEEKGPRRRVGKVEIVEDQVVLLGKSARLKVRFVWAKLPSGEDLILVSDLLKWSAEKLLKAYKRRWEIERFHNVVKEVIGLAHLYSFQQVGMEVLAQTAFLLASLVWMGAPETEGKKRELLVKVLRQLIRGIRRLWDKEKDWKRNMQSRPYKKKAPDATAAPMAAAA